MVELYEVGMCVVAMLGTNVGGKYAAATLGKYAMGTYVVGMLGM